MSARTVLALAVIAIALSWLGAIERAQQAEAARPRPPVFRGATVQPALSTAAPAPTYILTSVRADR